MTRLTKILLIILCGWLSAIDCPAGYISIKIHSTTSRFSPDGISVNLRITNNGDEPAKNVSMEASLADQSVKSYACKSLAAQESYDLDVHLGMPPPEPGVYTIVFKCRYNDGSNGKFMTLKSIPIVTAIPDPEKEPVSGWIEHGNIRKKATLTLNIKTADTIDSDINATLVLPEELNCNVPVQKIRLLAGEEKKLQFDITNKSALKDSHYYIFAVLDYDNGKQHRSKVASGNINVLETAKIKQTDWNIKNTIATIAIVILMILFGLAQIPKTSLIPKRALPFFQFFIFIAVLSFILSFFPGKLIFSDTLTTGGDTPAHAYLSSHLKDSLFTEGKIVSWADGWWAGFPMFQYYFCLPYLLIALLSFVIPFNIAFKLISILGIVMLPICAWLSGRIMKLPRPACHLLAIITIPLLFDRAHVMWGVNIYSTLAGMISASISFPLLLLFVACSSRDADDEKMRLHTILLLVLLLSSHFFTSIIAALSIAIIPLLRSPARMKKAFVVLLKEGLLAVVLMSWWLIPLLAKQAYSVDFGENWRIEFAKIVPGFETLMAIHKGDISFADGIPIIIGLVAMIIGPVLAIIMAIHERKHKFVPITLCILVTSSLLFLFGYDKISPVFVNVRLYPFIAYSFLALTAAGIGIAINKLKFSELAVLSIMIAVMIFAIGQPNHVSSWTEWNYSGIEGKKNYEVIEKLVLPLKGTPGRLANDLHDKNNSLGSTRVFESVPHLIEKPILEGGIVNSAAGSMFSYYIQGETSQNCAGFPTIVKPTTFNMENGTQHLELFNVKHFIARWDNTKKAMAASEDWKFINRCRDWELYELTTHNCEYVFIPKYVPVVVTTENWKETGLDWIYQIRAIDQPFAIAEDPPVAGDDIQNHVSEEQFHQILTCLKNTKTFPSWFKQTYSENLLPDDFPEISIIEEKTRNGFRFKTNAIGLPHIIKCSWFPNWKVKGAKKVYKVTPCFMLIYPEQSDVELYYGSTLADNTGRAITLMGLVFIAVTTTRSFRRKFSGANIKQENTEE